jgi:hypothetical protein
MASLRVPTELQIDVTLREVVQEESGDESDVSSGEEDEEEAGERRPVVEMVRGSAAVSLVDPLGRIKLCLPPALACMTPQPPPIECFASVARWIP